MNQPPTLALFDLDHTLLDGDSDVLWCEYLMDRGVLDRAVFEPRNRAIEAGYKAGTVGVLEFCGFYVGTPAGRTPAQWQPLREDFLHERIVPRLLAAGRACIEAHRRVFFDDAATTVICSLSHALALPDARPI